MHPCPVVHLLGILICFRQTPIPTGNVAAQYDSRRFGALEDVLVDLGEFSGNVRFGRIIERWTCGKFLGGHVCEVVHGCI